MPKPLPVSQISAFVSDATREQLDRYSDAHGVRKAHLVEEALLHHLQALRELPADLVIPPRITLTEASFEAVAAAVRLPRKPTKALRDLLRGKPAVDDPHER